MLATSRSRVCVASFCFISRCARYDNVVSAESAAVTFESAARTRRRCAVYSNPDLQYSALLEDVRRGSNHLRAATEEQMLSDTNDA